MRSLSGEDATVERSVLVDFLGIVNLNGGENSALKHYFFCHLDRVTSIRVNNKLNVVVICTAHDLSHESPPIIKLRPITSRPRFS